MSDEDFETYRSSTKSRIKEKEVNLKLLLNRFNNELKEYRL